MEVENKKICFVPGWMQTLNSYKKYTGIDLWRADFADDGKIDGVDYVIGHSLGASFALLNWKNDSSAKLILVNPLIAKRSVFDWAKRWLNFHSKEKLHSDREMIIGFFDLWRGIKKCFAMLRSDLVEILNFIPTENIVVVRGERDEFFCDQEVLEILRVKKIKIVEVPGAGHDWNEKFDEVIESIIDNKLS